MSTPMHLQPISHVDDTWRFRGTIKDMDLWQSRTGRSVFLLVSSIELFEQFEHAGQFVRHELGQHIYRTVIPNDLIHGSKTFRMWIDYHGDYDAIMAAMRIFERKGA